MTKPSTQDIAASNEMRALVQRLSNVPEKERMRCIAFIAARSGEGTSTMARNYATALATDLRQKVLLIEIGLPLQERRRFFAAKDAAGHVDVITLQSLNESMMNEPYDSFVVDAPSPRRSFEGVNAAARADATIIVVEAEKTPQPVIQNLLQSLNAAGAKTAGVVMNKRRYYIPNRIYGNL